MLDAFFPFVLVTFLVIFLLPLGFLICGLYFPLAYGLFALHDCWQVSFYWPRAILNRLLMPSRLYWMEIMIMFLHFLVRYLSS